MKICYIVTAFHPHEPASEQGFYESAVMARTWVLDRKQDHGSGVGKASKQVVGHGAGMEAAGFLLAVWAGRAAHLREEYPEEIRDLGCCTDGGPSGSDRVLLLDCDSRPDIDQPVHLRAVHLLQEHAGVGR